MNARRSALVLLAVAVVAGCSGGGGDEPGSAATTTAAEEATPGQEVRVLTYNVAGLPEGISGSHPEANSPRISPRLNDYDLVLLQEDFGFYTDLIRADAELEHLTEPHPGPGELNPIHRDSAAVGDGLNILSRWPLGEVHREPWTGCGMAAADCLALKGFAATTVALDGGLQVDVITLHAEAGDEDSQLRADDLDQLAGFLEANEGGRAVLIGGDWNLHTAEEPDGSQFDAFLERTGLTDTCQVVDCGADADEIDKIVFRSGGGVTLTPLDHHFERETFQDDQGEPLSDHDPLAVTFRITPE